MEERRRDVGLKYEEQKRNLTQKRKTDSSLQSIHSQVLQNVLLRLQRAFENYHRNITVGSPIFKRRDRYNSITYPQFGAFYIKDNRLRLTFIDGLIKIRFHRIPIGEIKTCTIIRDINRWFACFSCDSDRQKTRNGTMIGVDVGLHNWIKLSDGELIDRPRFQDTAITKIKRLQKALSRKKKGSKNREKARIVLSKAWRKVRLQREDYCHKVTTNLARRFQTIVFERLNIQNMVKNNKLARSIYDATWYKLRQLAAYKAEVPTVNPSGTTQECSRCGSKPQSKIGLDVRVYECSNCGLIIDRDYNAALNILKKGSERTLVEKQKAVSVKQEAHML